MKLLGTLLPIVLGLVSAILTAAAVLAPTIGTSALLAGAAVFVGISAIGATIEYHVNRFVGSHTG